MPKTDKITVRLALTKNDQDLLANIATILSDVGIDVEPSGKRALMLSADKILIERIFEAEIKMIDGQFSFAAEPKTTLLPDSEEYMVYFPSKPTSF